METENCGRGKKKQLSENWRDKGGRIDGEEKKCEGKNGSELEQAMRVGKETEVRKENGRMLRSAE